MSRAPTPLRYLPTIAGLDRVYVKDESQNPSGTFKDRLIEQAIQSSTPGTVLASISYGNTAFSLAFHLDGLKNPSLDLRGCVLVPEDWNTWRLGPSTSGNTVTGDDLRRRLEKSLTVISLPLDGPVLSDGDIAALVSERVPGRVQVRNITEGLEVPCYVEILREAVGQLGAVPDVCLVPFGAGILCNEAKDFLAGSGCHVVALSVGRRDSRAHMLYGPIWVDVETLESQGVALSRHRSPDPTGAVRVPYPVHCVQEREVLSGLTRARELGLSAEPSGSVGLGVLERLADLVPECKPGSSVLVINTGNGIDSMVSGQREAL